MANVKIDLLVGKRDYEEPGVLVQNVRAPVGVAGAFAPVYLSLQPCFTLACIVAIVLIRTHLF